VDGGLRIGEIGDINNIESKTLDEESDSYIENQLELKRNEEMFVINRFISGWKLNPDQFNNVLFRGSL